MMQIQPNDQKAQDTRFLFQPTYRPSDRPTDRPTNPLIHLRTDPLTNLIRFTFESHVGP